MNEYSHKELMSRILTDLDLPFRLGAITTVACLLAIVIVI